MPYIDSEKNKIYYEIHGKGVPLLLIHGLGSSSRDWELQIPEFSKYFRVIAIDLQGHGRSAKPPGPYSMSMFAGDAARVLEGLDASPAHVLGISLGGMVAFQLAVEHPWLLKGLVIVNSVPQLVPRNLGDLLGYWQRMLIVQFVGMEKMGQVLAERFFPHQEQSALREIFIRRWSENHIPSYRASLKAAYRWSVRERLGEIQAPVLVLSADGDYFPIEEKQAYTALMPNASLAVVKDSCHALPAEKPEEFNKIVLDFLISLLETNAS